MPSVPFFSLGYEWGKADMQGQLRLVASEAKGAPTSPEAEQTAAIANSKAWGSFSAVTAKSPLREGTIRNPLVSAVTGEYVCCLDVQTFMTALNVGRLLMGGRL
ncbi:hypothetical protein EGJ27_02075 [Pseudomonas sp. v388]|nr:hypothetical protein EGJ27_02075 [Pseudomonas sp. v388]